MIETAFVLRREDAILGSEQLRNAILVSKGLPVPESQTRIRRRKQTTKPRTRPVRKLPAVCPSCLAPVSRHRRLVAEIQQTVCAYYGFRLNMMISDSRCRDLTRARQVAMYLASQLTGHSIAEIGRRFNRDHTTVLHAIKEVNRRSEIDSEEAFDVSLLRESLAA